MQCYRQKLHQACRCKAATFVGFFKGSGSKRAVFFPFDAFFWDWR